MTIHDDGKRLTLSQGGTTLRMEAWGEHSIRVRMTKEAEMNTEDWALTEPIPDLTPEIHYETVDMTPAFYRTAEERAAHAETGTKVTFRNGNLTAVIDPEGVISYYNEKNELLTKELWQNRNRIDRFCVPLRIDARELKPITGTTDYTLAMRFEAFDDEKIFGMGQYQDDFLDKKGCILELAHRNSQASVPFMISSRGYGFLWNNPAIGTASFAKNKTEWTALNTKKLDYWICAGDSPKQLTELYSAVTGRVPMIPEYGIGFWQCKLRYRTQEELLTVAREYKRRGLPIDAIVVDFFHWTMQGDFKFDPKDWPDPEAMIRELREMQIEPVVSVWPTIDERSENYGPMADQGYLITSDRGLCVNMTWMGTTTFYDATHPGAQKYVWERCKENYYDKGIRCFWLDEAEPEYGPYDFDIYRYHKGPALQCSNIYPLMYAKGFYDGLREQGQENVLNLVRCAWAGSQKYGALTWSGDIHSSFRSMKQQVQAGLNMGLAGIPWWTTDIGGFHGGNIYDEDFKEVLVRWFEFGAFCPVFRLHGFREPFKEPLGTTGGGTAISGAENEVWSYGEEVYEICKKYLELRERMLPYVKRLMAQAHEKGTPVMRPLFYDFPEDGKCWEIEDEYMFGPEILVAPILYEKQRERKLYLPAGEWRSLNDGKVYAGGADIVCEAPIDAIPVFVKNGCLKELKF